MHIYEIAIPEVVIAMQFDEIPIQYFVKSMHIYEIAIPEVVIPLQFIEIPMHIYETAMPNFVIDMQDIQATNLFYHTNKTLYEYRERKGLVLTHAYVHLLADVHSAGFVPAFTLSQGDSEAPANRRMPIASVVRQHGRKRKTDRVVAIKSLKNCPLFRPEEPA